MHYWYTLVSIYIDLLFLFVHKSMFEMATVTLVVWNKDNLTFFTTKLNANCLFTLLKKSILKLDSEIVASFKGAQWEENYSWY